MQTSDQIGTSALPPSLRAPGAARTRFGRFELDEVKACLLRDGKVVALPPTPFAVLCALVRQPGMLLTKNALLDEVWGHQFVSDSVLKTVISELRTLLDDDARQPRFIETVSRRGYRFIAAENMSPDGSGLSAVAASGPSQAHPFIGREEELSRLHRAWDGACGGRCEVVWVAGESGIGKTQLVEQFVGRLDDVACVRGHCVEHHGTGEPYLPVLEALAELCRFDSSVSPLLRAVAPSWFLQLPWLSSAGERDALRGELPRLGLDGMLRELGEVLDRYTERRPLLLVTEDLHWSDRSTIQLIDYIARRRGSARLMWLATFRPAEVIALNHPLNRVRHELRLHEMCEEIMLDAFSENEVAEYVAQHLPSLAGDGPFVSALYERTDGLPMFVASLISEIVARSARYAEGRPQLADLAVPTQLTGIIDHYIAKLGIEQRALLSAAAVCGAEFRVSTLSHAIDRDGVAVGQACEELAREQLWLRGPRVQESSHVPEQPYSFRHGLFRQVLYERTAPLAREQLHRKVRAALEKERAEGVPITAAELAMHS